MFCICEGVYIYIYICVCIYVYVCVCMCMYVYVCVCVCESNQVVEHNNRTTKDTLQIYLVTNEDRISTQFGKFKNPKQQESV